MKTYYKLKIEECELRIKMYERLFAIARTNRDNDLAIEYAEEVIHNIKKKNEYTNKLEEVENGEL